MKITQISNFLNHHQLPICEEFISRFGEDFKFIALEKVPQERLSMNYQDMNHMYPFVINAYESEEKYNQACDLCNRSDIVIIGGCSEKIVRQRIKDNKLTFKYFERIYKRGLWRLFSPRGLQYMFSEHTAFRRKNVFLLCASAYASFDFQLVGAYPKKKYKWGYFPKVRTVEELKGKLDKESKMPLSILWVGRMLDWKHPEVIIEIAKMCKDEKMNVKFHMIGNGELCEHIKRLIAENRLENHITLDTFKDNAAVIEDMIASDIFLATSDYQEGWGAVINEAMSCACVTIASHAMGAAPFLIKNNNNGYIYKSGDLQELFSYIKNVYKNPETLKRIQRNAFNSMTEMWNAKIAVDRFVKTAESIMTNQNNKVIYSDGPMSNSKPIADWFMYQKCQIGDI